MTIVRKLTFDQYVVIQNDLNELTVPGWRNVLTVDQYRTAIFDELAELMGSSNWKWWKHQDQYNRWNAKIEVVDIFHFALSIFILNKTHVVSGDHIFGENREDFAQLFDMNGNLNHTLFINKAVDLLHEHCPSEMDALFSVAGMTAEEVSATYIAKAQLNVFRQQQGYKDGSYRKIVDGMEDNERLKKFVDKFLEDDKMSIQNLIDEIIEYFYEHSEPDKET
jgi:dimeric dUTPase (all-alpha-NTP-PPase superfamily)